MKKSSFHKPGMRNVLVYGTRLLTFPTVEAGDYYIEWHGLALVNMIETKGVTVSIVKDGEDRAKESAVIYGGRVAGMEFLDEDDAAWLKRHASLLQEGAEMTFRAVSDQESAEILTLRLFALYIQENKIDRTSDTDRLVGALRAGVAADRRVRMAVLNGLPPSTPGNQIPGLSRVNTVLTDCLAIVLKIPNWDLVLSCAGIDAEGNLLPEGSDRISFSDLRIIVRRDHLYK